MKKHLSPAQFIESIEEQIYPGTRGAPDRRALHHRTKAAHQTHMENLACHRWDLSMDRSGSRYNAESKFNVPMGILRHGPSDPHKEKVGRLYKMHRRLMTRIKKAPPEYLIKIRDGLKLPMESLGYESLNRYLSAYLHAKKELRIYRGKIYKYAVSTEWDKYGSRSYPRTVDRRIEVITRTEIKTHMYLDHGQRAESALDQCIKNRVGQRKKLVAAKEKSKMREANRIKPAYKIVEKNGNLRSVFNPDFVYPLKRWVSDTLKDDHRGGIYCYNTTREAIKAAEQNTVFGDAWTNGKSLVLCECKRRGAEILYGNKIAVQELLISSVIEEIDTPN